MTLLAGCPPTAIWLTLPDFAKQKTLRTLRRMVAQNLLVVLAAQEVTHEQS